jgi:hypothetical protein
VEPVGNIDMSACCVVAARALCCVALWCVCGELCCTDPVTAVIVSQAFFSDAGVSRVQELDWGASLCLSAHSCPLSVYPLPCCALLYVLPSLSSSLSLSFCVSLCVRVSVCLSVHQSLCLLRVPELMAIEGEQVCHKRGPSYAVVRSAQRSRIHSLTHTLTHSLTR